MKHLRKKGSSSGATLLLAAWRWICTGVPRACTEQPQPGTAGVHGACLVPPSGQRIRSSAATSADALMAARSACSGTPSERGRAFFLHGFSAQAHGHEPIPHLPAPRGKNAHRRQRENKATKRAPGTACRCSFRVDATMAQHTSGSCAAGGRERCPRQAVAATTACPRDRPTPRPPS